jgi:hypothetical protein
MEAVMNQTYLSADDLTLCKAALDAACADIGVPSSSVRSEMATRIMARAMAGERDIQELKASAVAWIQAA